MPDEDDHVPFGASPADGLVPVVLSTAAAALDPTGGVLASITGHVLTNMSMNSAWRGQVHDLWKDIIIENDANRRREYEETKGEFHRQQLILDWIREELGRHSTRLDNFEGVALNFLAQTESLLRERPDPEMRPYIRNACANALRMPYKFTATWVRRLNPLLAKMGVEHVEMLLSLAGEAEDATLTGSRLLKKSGEEMHAIRRSQRLLTFRELIDFGVIQQGTALIVTLHGSLLADYVSASGVAEKPKPVV